MKRTAPKLEQAARRLSDALGKGSSVLIGALALAAHGYVRATTDVDLMSRLPLDEARKRLLRSGLKSALERGDVHDGGFDCLHGDLSGVPFDILPAIVPVDWDRSVEVRLPGGGSLHVADLRTLIHLKLRAGGPMDVLDVVKLLQLHPEEEEAARSLARGFGLDAQLESFANNPRVKGRARATPGRPGRRSRS